MKSSSDFYTDNTVTGSIRRSRTGGEITMRYGHSLFTTSAGLLCAAFSTCPNTVSKTNVAITMMTPASNHNKQNSLHQVSLPTFQYPLSKALSYKHYYLTNQLDG